MTTKYWRAQVTLTNLDGIPKNNFVNDFAFFDTAGEMDSGPLAVTEALDHFYNRGPSGTDSDALCRSIGKSVTRATGGISVKYYDVTGHLDGSAVGSLVWEDAFTLHAESG